MPKWRCTSSDLIIGRLSSSLEVLLAKLSDCDEMTNDKGKSFIASVFNYVINIDPTAAQL